ncbi:ATP-binding protein [Rathayibacter agropyri]|uniref:ATP-binding protein n=1 Tax=Rathayibacter agropyri TaxID=1634927 RepID=UPI0015653A09|nr:ATP-binding protein [Rathayibacter agropyri]
MPERSFVVRTPPEDGVSVVHQSLTELWEEAPDVERVDRMSFETALIELTSNIVQHAHSYRHVICVVEIHVSATELRASLNDSAEEAPAEVADVRPMPDEWEEAGRGIPFIHALVSEFSYRRVDGQNLWTLARART